MNKSKSIIYTGPFRFPKGDAAAARVLNNAKIFRELGYDVVFISWGGDPINDKDRLSCSYYQGFRYIISNDIDLKKKKLYEKAYYHIFAGHNALRIINSYANNCDVIIGYNTPYIFTKYIMSLCKKRDILFIADLSEWYSPKEFPGGKYCLPALLNEINMRFNLKNVKYKIVVSSYLDKYYSNSINIVLPPLIDLEEKKWSIDKNVLPSFDGTRFIYAGFYKNKEMIELILRAIILCIKNGLNIQFILVGVSKEELKYMKFEDDIRKLDNRLIFCGVVPQSDIPLYYRSSDYSLIIREPTRKNLAGFPTKAVESLVSGCPVIINMIGDIAKYVIDSYNGYIVDNCSLSLIKKCIERLAGEDKNKRKIMKENAKKTGMANFLYTNHIERVRGFLEKIGM